MNYPVSKIIFYSFAVLLLGFFILASKEAGISGDEDLHLKQSELVYRYFASGAKDQSCNNTPKTHLQYYGQSVDNISTILTHWFNIKDIYTFRHLVSAFLGWLLVLLTALFVVYLIGYEFGVLALLFLTISPFIVGHSINNLKDIPFALAYISSLFFIIRFFKEEKRRRWLDGVFLVISMAFALSIRAGGLLVFFYVWFYFFLTQLVNYQNKNFLVVKFWQGLFLVLIITVISYGLGLVLWPYGFQHPISNPWKSYQVMADFPTTLRQIFEGQSWWSDQLPWYYLPKYMLITIPLVVFLGLGGFILRSGRILSESRLVILFLLFSIVFPMIFVIVKKSNLYGCWRHFLFIYPGIVIISVLGFSGIFDFFNKKIYKMITGVVIGLLFIQPISYMINNHPYYYLYYNQLVGGLKGAYGQYETDYYYHSVRKASEWLSSHIKTTEPNQSITVGGNFSTQWFFKDQKNVRTLYFPYDERSRFAWDYAIVVNSYIHPSQLQNHTWPPKNTIHEIKADGVPICAVIKRVTQSDTEGILKLEAGNSKEAIPLLETGLAADFQNPYLWYKYASALHHEHFYMDAEIALEKGLAVLPEDELILQLAGDISLEKGDTLSAMHKYDKAIRANCKFQRPYVKLAKLYFPTDRKKSRRILIKCLQSDSRYKPAIQALADSYRDTDSIIAHKYDQLANSIK